MHLWILLSTPLLAVTSELSPSASQQTDSNVHSRHFAVRTGDDGSREVVSLDSAGPAFELAGALAVFGPDDIFLVLDPEASGGLRDVRLMDASFAQVSAFEIPVDLAPLLGGQGLVRNTDLDDLCQKYKNVISLGSFDAQASGPPAGRRRATGFPNPPRPPRHHGPGLVRRRGDGSPTSPREK